MWWKCLSPSNQLVCCRLIWKSKRILKIERPNTHLSEIFFANELVFWRGRVRLWDSSYADALKIFWIEICPLYFHETTVHGHIYLIVISQMTTIGAIHFHFLHSSSRESFFLLFFFFFFFFAFFDIFDIFEWDSLANE